MPKLQLTIDRCYQLLHRRGWSVGVIETAQAYEWLLFVIGK